MTAIQCDGKDVLSVHHVVKCPRCEGGFWRVDHVFAADKPWPKVGPWRCHKWPCQATLTLTRMFDGGYEAEFGENKDLPALTLLRYGRLYLVVADRRYEISDENYQSHKRYYYHEHTCTTNWMSQVVQAVWIDGDDEDMDPHGVFRVVKHVLCPAELKEPNPDFVSFEHFLQAFGLTMEDLKGDYDPESNITGKCDHCEVRYHGSVEECYMSICSLCKKELERDNADA